MKEYNVFVDANGDLTAYVGGQFALGTSNEGFHRNLGRLWEVIEGVGAESVVEVKNLGVNRDGVQTYRIFTVPKAQATAEPENCREGRCGHPKNFAGSCVVYLLQNPPQRDCR